MQGAGSSPLWMRRSPASRQACRRWEPTRVGETGGQNLAGAPIPTSHPQGHPQGPGPCTGQRFVLEFQTDGCTARQELRELPFQAKCSATRGWGRFSWGGAASEGPGVTQRPPFPWRAETKAGGWGGEHSAWGPVRPTPSLHSPHTRPLVPKVPPWRLAHYCHEVLTFLLQS